MNKTYDEIVSVVRGDIKILEELIAQDDFFSENVFKSLLSAPAKRIRPALVFLFLRANGYEVTEAQYTLQAAVELAHTASLIHDDVIDKSDIRRGKATLNAVYGDKYAILVGDYTLSVALNKILSLKNDKILKDFVEVFSEMSLGEISQLLAKNQIPTLEDYLTKTRQKTAGLFEVALKSAARLTKNEEIVPQWSKIGENFGVAFQIKNDLKDVEIDMKSGIFTAPVIFAGGPAVGQEAILKTRELKNSFIEKIKIEPQNEYFRAIIELLELMKND